MEQSEIIKEVGERLKSGEDIVSIKTDFISRGINLEDISYELSDEEKKPKSLRNVLISFGFISIFFGLFPYFSLPGGYFKSFDNNISYILGNHIFEIIGIILLYFGFKKRK